MTHANRLLTQLSGGTRRSIGRSNEVAREVLDDPAQFPALFAGMQSKNPVVRMRAADACEKVTGERPDLLQPFRRALLEEVAQIDQSEVQWHVALMVPRLVLSPRGVRRAEAILERYLQTTRSNIVRVMALQALADLALQGKLDATRIAKGIEQYAALVNTASVSARARKLKKKLEGAQTAVRVRDTI